MIGEIGCNELILPFSSALINPSCISTTASAQSFTMKPLWLLSWYSSGMNTKVSCSFSRSAGVAQPQEFAEIKYFRNSDNLELDLSMLSSVSKNLVPMLEILNRFRFGTETKLLPASATRSRLLSKGHIAFGSRMAPVVSRVFLRKSFLRIESKSKLS